MKKLFIFFLLLCFLSQFVIAPPEPRNVNGFVFRNGGVGESNGIPVRINNTNSNELFTTQVFAPPVIPGAYSATIVADINDILILHAWNATHYGVSNATVQVTTTLVNITINNTRSAEPNVTITFPANNTIHDSTYSFNVTANVTVVGATGQCNATVIFTNETILNVSSGETFLQNLGVVSINTTRVVNWSVKGQQNGVVNITVVAICEGSGPVFETYHIDTVYNITLQDLSPPNITIFAPANNTLNKTTDRIHFTYRVTDVSSVNCSLIVNGTQVNGSNDTSRDTTNTFLATLLNGEYNWTVSCVDIYSQIGTGNGTNLTVEYHPPNVSVYFVTPSIVLNAGTTTEVLCNITVVDFDGMSNIEFLNVTLYNNITSVTDPESNNTKYTNTTCNLYSSTSTEGNYSCSFDLQYYTVNGSWVCNATALDFEGLLDTDDNLTTVDPLYALNVSSTEINYGPVEAGFTTTKQNENVSNIGNLPIQISVLGYGSAIGDGLSFDCPIDDIEVNYTRYAQNSTAIFSQMQELTSSLSLIPRITVSKQNITGNAPFNTTYWQVFVPKDTSDVGECTGNIVFHAEIA